jgi:hypothetical protein
VIVGLLLIGALLVDRFVLLPEFDGDGGSAGAALAAWLGVNLLPALAWLALNARKGERTRGQLLAGTLAVITTTAILIVPVLIWHAAEDEAPDETGGLTGAVPSAEARRVADRCDWSVGSGRAISGGTVRTAFQDSSRKDDVALLMEGTSFRPGATFAVAVRNGSNAAVTYGVQTSVEDAETGEIVHPDEAIAYPAIGLVVQPGGVGPCVSVRVPDATSHGIYRAVLEVRGARGVTEALRAEFAVAGLPPEG